MVEEVRHPGLSERRVLLRWMVVDDLRVSRDVDPERNAVRRKLADVLGLPIEERLVLRKRVLPVVRRPFF